MATLERVHERATHDADTATARADLGSLPRAQDVREELARNVSRARALFGEDREEATTILLGQLDAVMALPAKDAADILKELLDSGVLEGLTAQDGWTARARAASLLISLPWPHALQIRPEDLTHLRDVEKGPARPSRQVANPSIVPIAYTAVGALVDLVFTSAGLSPIWLGATVVALAAGAVHAGGLATKSDLLRWDSLATAALFCVGIAAAVAPIFTDGGAGFFLGVGAFVGGLTAWLKR